MMRSALLRPQTPTVVAIVVGMIAFGLVVLYSATSVLGIDKFNSEFYFVYRQGIAAVFGICLMLLVSQVPYQTWKTWAPFLLACVLVLMAATHFSPFAHTASGATRWLRFGQFQFQPSEIAKPIVVIYVSSILASHDQVKFSIKKWVGLVTPILLILGLIFLQPDLGTTAILVGVSLGLCFVAGLRKKFVALFILVGGGMFALAMFQSEYRARRFFSFLNPWADPHGSGFQVIQSFLSFHNGKIIGVGLGNGNSKLFFLPEVHTDFIFSLIGEELGFMGSAVLLLTFTYLIYLLFKLAANTKSPLGCYLAFGLTLTLAIQVLINLGGVTGILPVKGLPLPFFSWGRSALISNLFGLGILLNILKQSEIIHLERMGQESSRNIKT